MQRHPEQYHHEENAARRQLGILEGRWKTVGTHPMFPAPASGESTFEWLEDTDLLIWRFSWDGDGPPDAVSIIGHDDPETTYSILYSDERGTARIYHMTIDGHAWKFWREAPGFSQRFTGVISDDGQTITGHGELNRDGKNWEQDLDVIYTREQ